MSLRQKYTDKEWNDFEKKIKEDRENGKPDEILLHLSVWNKDVSELKKSELLFHLFIMIIVYQF